jgi:hypothetical protein
MRTLFEMDYALVTTPNKSFSSNVTVLVTQSVLDADFNDEKDFDEIEYYISEKPANKEMNVMAWWKVYYKNIYLFIS